MYIFFIKYRSVIFNHEIIELLLAIIGDRKGVPGPFFWGRRVDPFAKSINDKAVIALPGIHDAEELIAVPIKVSAVTAPKSWDMPPGCGHRHEIKCNTKT